MARRDRRPPRRTWDDLDEPEPRRRRPSQREQRRRGRDRTPVVTPAPITAPRSLLAPVEASVSPTCGGCREFVVDEMGGRGECLHPGSGILRPWWDTPGCAFFQR